LNQTAHLISDADVVLVSQLGSERDNFPRYLETWNIRGTRRRRVVALTLHHVRSIDPGRRYPYQYFARPGSRHCSLGRLKRFRAARLAEHRAGASDHRLYLYADWLLGRWLARPRGDW